MYGLYNMELSEGKTNKHEPGFNQQTSTDDILASLNENLTSLSQRHYSKDYDKTPQYFKVAHKISETCLQVAHNWKGISSSNSVITRQLHLSLNEVSMLANILLQLITKRTSVPEKCPEEVLVCATNVVKACSRAISDIKAANLTFNKDSSRNIRLKTTEHNTGDLISPISIDLGSTFSYSPEQIKLNSPIVPLSPESPKKNASWNIDLKLHSSEALGKSNEELSNLCKLFDIKLLSMANNDSDDKNLEPSSSHSGI